MPREETKVRGGGGYYVFIIIIFIFVLLLLLLFFFFFGGGGGGTVIEQLAPISQYPGQIQSLGRGMTLIVPVDVPVLPVRSIMMRHVWSESVVLSVWPHDVLTHLYPSVCKMSLRNWVTSGKIRQY